jgi:hypothetical protein
LDGSSVLGALEDLLEARFADQDAGRAHEVQGVEVGGVGEDGALEVAAGAEHGLGPGAVDDQEALAFGGDGGEDLGEELCLRLGDLELLDHREAAVLGELEEGALQGDLLGLRGDGLGPVAGARTEDDAALEELGGALVAVAGAAGALLREDLLTGAGDLAVVLGLGSALALVGLVGDDDLLEQRDALVTLEGGDVELLRRRRCRRTCKL